MTTKPLYRIVLFSTASSHYWRLMVVTSWKVLARSEEYATRWAARATAARLAAALGITVEDGVA
jgi:hypothetical protein